MAIIGFIALLLLGGYLAYVAAACWLLELGFTGRVSPLTYAFAVISGIVLFVAFYFAPFTVTWSMR